MPTKAQLIAENALLRAQLAELKGQVMVDPLTELYTRRFLDDRIRATQNDAKRNGHLDVFVLFVDVDHFKQVNDTHGHDSGDRVLFAVASAVKSVLRANDIAARYGGEEIVILGRGDGLKVAERIRVAVENEVVENEPAEPIGVTVSIGVAIYNPSLTNDSIPATIVRADEAMYRAKNAGRNRVSIAPSLTTPSR